MATDETDDKTEDKAPKAAKATKGLTDEQRAKARFDRRVKRGKAAQHSAE